MHRLLIWLDHSSTSYMTRSFIDFSYLWLDRSSTSNMTRSFIPSFVDSYLTFSRLLLYCIVLSEVLYSVSSYNYSIEKDMNPKFKLNSIDTIWYLAIMKQLFLILRNNKTNNNTNNHILHKIGWSYRRTFIVV